MPTETDYKVWWKRDSTALGKCLQEIHTLRATLEDQQAEIKRLRGEIQWLVLDIKHLTRRI